jgi:hypothetical protein
MLKSEATAKLTIARIGGESEGFGALRGKTGVFTRRTDKQDRERALANVAALARNLERYLRSRAETELRHKMEERAVRLKASVAIPALSDNARQTLERIGDAIERNDLPASIEIALSDGQVKAELEAFTTAVNARFGERAFLAIAAKDANGHVFSSVTAGMNPTQKAEIREAWISMRTVQKLAAAARTTDALKQAETLRQTKAKGLNPR